MFDKIIFINGDTIYGNVMEVGINDITYRFKGEQTNYISNKRDITRVIYSSGRVDNFDKYRVDEDNEKAEKKTKNVELIGQFVGIAVAGVFIIFGLVISLL
jgi:hypothetical protein